MTNLSMLLLCGPFSAAWNVMRKSGQKLRVRSKWGQPGRAR